MSLQIRYKQLVLDQDNNFYLISLNVLITCLLDKCMDILGRSLVLVELLGVKGLTRLWIEHSFPSAKSILWVQSHIC